MAISDLIFVCVGGAVGSGARYLATLAMNGVAARHRYAGEQLPMGTFLVNVGGSFILGLLIELIVAHKIEHTGVRLALTTGLMGGFTTYSTFNHETLLFAERGAHGLALTYVFLTVTMSLGAGILGLHVGRAL